MYDRETKSEWLHLTGECIGGAREGEKLLPISGRHVQWGEWKRDHPATDVVMARTPVPGGVMPRGDDWFPEGFLETIMDQDTRLLPNELVVGIEGTDESFAFPFGALAATPGQLVQTKLGATPVVIGLAPDTRSPFAYSRVLGDTILHFKRDGADLIDIASGSRFTAGGVCTAGPLSGRSLLLMTSVQAEWYGWYAAHPHTVLWMGSPDTTEPLLR